MNIMQKPSLFRTVTAAGLLLLFTFTGLFAIHQNGTTINEAIAQSSSSNNGPSFWRCVKAIAKCAAAEATAIVICQAKGWLSLECFAAQANAVAACADVPGAC